jgi:hypothetical protein
MTNIVTTAGDALAAINESKQLDTGVGTDAGTLTGVETLPVSRGTGRLQTSLTKIATWLLGTFQGFTQNGAGATARTIVSRMQEDLRVTDFGADPTGVNSSDAAVLAAVTLAQATGQAVRFPAGTYLLTKSLNCTSAGIPAHPVWLVGDGQNNSNISGNLTEAFPMIDFTNNKRGGIKGLSLSTKSTSLDTCALLLAETVATGCGLVSIEDCGISSSSPTAWASMIGWCADQTLVRGSYFYQTSKYGVIFGAQNIAGVLRSSAPLPCKQATLPTARSYSVTSLDKPMQHSAFQVAMRSRSPIATSPYLVRAAPVSSIMTAAAMLVL